MQNTRRDLLKVVSGLGLTEALIGVTQGSPPPTQTVLPLSKAVTGAVELHAHAVLHGIQTAQPDHDSHVRLHAAMATMFAEMEANGHNDALPAMFQRAVNSNPSILNPTSEQIKAALAKSNIAAPELFLRPLKLPTLKMSDIIPMFSPDGFRSSQKSMLDRFATITRITPARWTNQLEYSLVEVSVAEVAAVIGAGFVALGAAAAGILGGAAGEVVGVVALAVGGAFLLLAALVFLEYEISQ